MRFQVVRPCLESVSTTPRLVEECQARKIIDRQRTKRADCAQTTTVAQTKASPSQVGALTFLVGQLVQQVQSVGQDPV